MAASGLVWDLLARDQASPTFLRVASAADKTAAATARAQKGVRNWTAGAAAAGAKLTKSLTLPIAALGAVSVDQAAKYQKALNVVAVATDQTAAQMTSTSKGLLKISTETATSTTQLTDALYTVEKGGLRGSKALDAVRAAAQGAKAEGADLGTVTDALTSIMASYGKKLSDPVKAMDMIVRGSGLAKTSIQDFSGSLSNVVPVAASLGITFDQVAGAIATMTQHGETAQHATDNLRNLITNLGGQNSVAAAAMQQLGINVVDLTRNLSKRGLTGTLQIVDAALKAHTKNGMIVTDVHRAASLATQSLNEELGAMSGKLKNQSQALLSGRTGIAAYTKYAKSMGGQQGAMALQFLALYKSSLGFNNQLKAGKGTITTSAAALQKMLGGITGMNVALQLSGESAKYFNEATKEVGDAAKSSSKDVLGFSNTQQTLTYKADALKASLHVMAIDIGTALLPALTKMATAGVKAANWFNNLSSGQKKVALWSLGILAALGPVLSIGAKLALAVKAMAAFAVRLGVYTSEMVGYYAAQGAAAQRMAAQTVAADAEATAANAAAAGSASRLRATLIGIGGSGAAVATGVGVAVLALQHLNDQLKSTHPEASKLLNPGGGPVGNLKRFWSEISIGGGSISDLAAQYRKLIAAQDASTKSANAAAAAQKKVTDATNAALRAIRQTQFNASKMAGNLTQQVATHGTSLSTSTSDGQANIAYLTSVIDKYRQIQKQQTLAGYSTDYTAKAFAASTAALKQQAIQAGLSGDAVQALINKYKLTPKEVVTYLLANISKGTASANDLQRIINSIKQNKVPGLTANSAQGKAAIAELQARINALKGKNVTVGVSTGDTISRLANLTAMLNGLHDKSITVTEYQQQVGHGRAAAGNATGGYITGPGSGTSDSILSWLSNGEFVINAKSTKKHKALLQAINNDEALPRYASGGSVGKARVAAGKKLTGIDTSALAAALRGVVDDTRTAINTLIGDMKTAAASAKALKASTLAARALFAKQSQFLAAKDYSGSVADTLRGTFQSGSYGSVTDLLAGLGGQTSQNNAYASELNGLRAKAKGNSALTGFINQLAAQGQTATLQTLAGASKSQLAQVTKGLSAYNGSISAGANAAVVTQYGESLTQLSNDMRVYVHTIGVLAAAVGKNAQHSDAKTQAAIAKALAQLNAQLAKGRKR